jgi:hypothetical protein
MGHTAKTVRGVTLSSVGNNEAVSSSVVDVYFHSLYGGSAMSPVADFFLGAAILTVLAWLLSRG